MKRKRAVSILLLVALLLCGCGQREAVPAEGKNVSGHELAEAVSRKMQKKGQEAETGPDLSVTVVDSSHMEDPLPPRVFKYSVRVNIRTNTVTVYAKGEDGTYSVPYLGMICSTGEATPTEGTYYLTGSRWPWLSLQGNVFGQCVTQIVGNILFHSVPYERLFDKASLETEEFNKLGTSASLGCVRLQMGDAAWIYDNAASIEFVEFYADDDPGPLDYPAAPYLPLTDERSCWDPTDPDPENPWNVNEG